MQYFNIQLENQIQMVHRFVAGKKVMMHYESVLYTSNFSLRNSSTLSVFHLRMLSSSAMFPLSSSSFSIGSAPLTYWNQTHRQEDYQDYGQAPVNPFNSTAIEIMEDYVPQTIWLF